MVTSVATLTGFTYSFGSGPSVEQSFTVSGTGLSGNITVTPPTNFEISTTAGSGFQSTAITIIRNGGTVPNTNIYVRLVGGLTAGTYTGENIVVAYKNCLLYTSDAAD